MSVSISALLGYIYKQKSVTSAELQQILICGYNVRAGLQRICYYCIWVEGKVWYFGQEVPWMLLLGFV